MSNDRLVITLRARIEDDRVVVTFASEQDRVELHTPENIVGAHRDAKEITLEIRDFVHDDTIYEVYAAVLNDDGHSIADYWVPNDNGTGQRYSFEVAGARRASPGDFLIGATPRRPDLPEPKPLITTAYRSDPGPSNDEEDEKKKR